MARQRFKTFKCPSDTEEAHRETFRRERDGHKPGLLGAADASTLLSLEALQMRAGKGSPRDVAELLASLLGANAEPGVVLAHLLDMILGGAAGREARGALRERLGRV